MTEARRFEGIELAGRALFRGRAIFAGRAFRERLAIVLLVVPIALALAMPAPAEAQAQGGTVMTEAGQVGDVLTLGLEDALRLALEQNRDVAVARAGLEQAQEQVGEAWSSVYPSVDFSASYTRNVSPQVSFLPAEFFGGGGDGDGEEFVAVQFGADNAWQTSINLEQPLFQAGAFIGVSAAGRYEELQQEMLRGSIQETVTRVRTQYFDLLLAQEEVRLTENSLERVRSSLQDTRAMNEVELASDYDVLRLEVEEANLVPTLRTAQSEVERARRALALDLDLEDPAALRVEGSLAAIDLTAPEENTGANREILTLMGLDLDQNLDTARIMDRAQSRRSEVIQAEATEDLRLAELRVQQAEYLPRVALFGSYGIQAQQNGAPEFFGSGRSRAYSRNVGISVSVPIFTGFQRDAAADRLRATLRQARLETDVARDQARKEVLDLLDEVEEARLRAQGQRLAVRQAQRGYEIASAEYQESLSGRLELTDAEVALRESEFNYAQAVYDYLVARARLDRAVGEVPLVDLGPVR